MKMQQRADVETGRSGSNEREIDSSSQSDHAGTSLDKQLRASGAYSKNAPGAQIAVVQGLNRPFFHIDLTSALQSAISNYEAHEARHHAQAKEDVGGKDVLA